MQQTITALPSPTSREEAIAYATSHPVRERLRGLARLLDRALSDRRVAAVSLAAAIMGLLVTTMAMPTAAMANPITDAVNEVLNGLGGAFGGLMDSWLGPFFTDGANWWLEQATKAVSAISANEILTGTYTKLLGGSAPAGVPNIPAVVSTICKSIVKPCANTILAFVIILQLLKIVRRFDQGGGTMPTVREVLTLLVVCSLFMFFVNNAEWVMRGVFSLCQDIVLAIDKQLDTYDLSQNLKFVNSGETTSAIKSLGAVILSVVMYGAALVANVFVQFSAIARAFTIYIMTAFAPIPFAMLGFDETKSWGIGYLRLFITEVIAAALILFTVWAFPVAVMCLTSGTVDIMDLGNFARMLAAIFVLTSFCGKSGELAGRIFGQG